MYTPEEVLKQVSLRFRELRLARSLTQEGLAKRSGVSWGTLKRFETTGRISFESLLKLALVLDVLDEFASMASARPMQGQQTLDDVLRGAAKSKSRGTLK